MKKIYLYLFDNFIFIGNWSFVVLPTDEAAMLAPTHNIFLKSKIGACDFYAKYALAV